MRKYFWHDLFQLDSASDMIQFWPKKWNPGGTWCEINCADTSGILDMTQKHFIYLLKKNKFCLTEFVFVILIPCDSQAKGKRKFTDQRLKLPIFYMMQSIFAGYFQHRLRPANVFPFISKIIKWFKFTGKIGVTHLSHLPIHFSEYYQISAAATFWIGKKQSTFI